LFQEHNQASLNGTPIAVNGVGKKMRRPHVRLSYVLLGGLAVISFGFASSVGLRPTGAFLSLFSVIGGLAVMTLLASGSGPRRLL
jgi:hypothetical protein